VPKCALNSFFGRLNSVFSVRTNTGSVRDALTSSDPIQTTVVMDWRVFQFEANKYQHMMAFSRSTG
jgi:hypothetical protein